MRSTHLVNFEVQNTLPVGFVPHSQRWQKELLKIGKSGEVRGRLREVSPNCSQALLFIKPTFTKAMYGMSEGYVPNRILQGTCRQSSIAMSLTSKESKILSNCEKISKAYCAVFNMMRKQCSALPGGPTAFQCRT